MPSVRERRTRPASLLPAPRSCQAVGHVQGRRRTPPELSHMRTSTGTGAALRAVAGQLDDGISRKTRPVPRRGDRAFSGTLRHLSRQAWRGVRSSRAWCGRMRLQMPRKRAVSIAGAPPSIGARVLPTTAPSARQARVAAELARVMPQARISVRRSSYLSGAAARSSQRTRSSAPGNRLSGPTARAASRYSGARAWSDGPRRDPGQPPGQPPRGAEGEGCCRCSMQRQRMR